MAVIAGAVIALLLAALAWLAWERHTGTDAPVLATDAPVKPNARPVVSVQTLYPEPYQQVIVIAGQTVPGPVVEVTATTAGTFTGATVDADMNVAAGQVVATMKASPLPPEAPIQTVFRPDGAAYDTPAPVVPPVTSSIPREEAPVGSISLTTPATGRVMPLPWPPGTLLSQGQPVVRVMTLDPLSMEGMVTPAEAARLQPGMNLSAYLENGTAVSGTVTVRGPASADPAGRYQVTARLATRDDLPPTQRQSLQPGLNGRMVVPVEIIPAFKAQHAWLVPTTDNRMALMTVVSDTVTPVTVTLLADSPTGVWLTGLPEGGAVVITGWTQPLAAGQIVTLHTPATEQ